MRELSNFYGDNGSAATVFKDEDGYFATVKSVTGVYYTARFNSEEDAEAYAEDWVNKDE
jgi:viroplasmin and RNaseH domain-containing protein